MSTIIAISMFVINAGCASAATRNESTCNARIEHPCLVQDADTVTESVKNYRDGNMLAAAYQGDTTGLSHLWISGSVTPNQHDLITIAKLVAVASNRQAVKIIDLDLREENHAIVNDNPMTLATKNDWVNMGKSREQIILEEANWQISLLNQKTLHDVLTPTQFKSGDYVHGTDINVNTVQSEASIASTAGFDYIRMTITDHMAPKAKDVDDFIQLISQLPANTWLYVHCRGGKGRTTTFMAMYDMLYNADKVSFDDIIKRQAAVAPFEDLSKVEDKNPELLKYYQERYDFLKRFYQYAAVRRHGSHLTWSEWIATPTASARNDGISFCVNSQ